MDSGIILSPFGFNGQYVHIRTEESEMRYEVVKMFCQFCGKEIVAPSEFKNKESLREYFISGMCQKCQDDVFEDMSISEAEKMIKKGGN